MNIVKLILLLIESNKRCKETTKHTLSIKYFYKFFCLSKLLECAHIQFSFFEDEIKIKIKCENIVYLISTFYDYPYSLISFSSKGNLMLMTEIKLKDVYRFIVKHEYEPITRIN